MKLIQKDTQKVWTTGGLIHEGYIKVGSKTYEEYWKHPKDDNILTLHVVKTSIDEFEGLKDYLEESHHVAICDYFARRLNREGFCFNVAEYKNGVANLQFISYDEWDNNPDEVMESYWSKSKEDTITWCNKICKSWNYR